MKLLMLLPLLATGCSFALDSVPVGHPREAPTCTHSIAPGADLVGAGLLGTLGTLVATSHCTEGPGNDCDTGGLKPIVAAVLLVPAALYAVAAANGIHRNAACEEAHEAHDRWHTEHPFQEAEVGE